MLRKYAIVSTVTGRVSVQSSSKEIIEELFQSYDDEYMLVESREAINNIVKTVDRDRDANIYV